jgi:hypothetical protein
LKCESKGGKNSSGQTKPLKIINQNEILYETKILRFLIEN